MKIKINSQSDDSARAYAHLIPIVEALVEAGNKWRGNSMFYLDVDGWRCDLYQPIDFGLLTIKFDLPKSILISEETDSILCKNTWIEIRGGIPEGYDH